MSAASRDAPRRSRPCPSPDGSDSQRPIAPATSIRPIRRATTRGIRKLSRRNCASVVGDPVLVARDDRGVRDRQAERMAEQRGHREPVGQPADHRRFGERADEADRGVQPLVRARVSDVQRRHRDQQPGRDDAHAPERGRGRRPRSRGRQQRTRHARNNPRNRGLFKRAHRDVHSAGCGASSPAVADLRRAAADLRPAGPAPSITGWPSSPGR